MTKMSPTTNLMIAFAKMRQAGMGEVSDALIELVNGLPGVPSTADLLRIVARLTREWPEHEETIIAMFTQGV